MAMLNNQMVYVMGWLGYSHICGILYIYIIYLYIWDMYGHVVFKQPFDVFSMETNQDHPGHQSNLSLGDTVH